LLSVNQNHYIVKKLFILLILASSSALFAQSNMRLGAHIDPIFSWFSPKTSHIEKDGARLGYNGGLIMEYYFAPNYALVSGLNLTQLGGNLLYNDEVDITTGEGDHVLLPPQTTVAFNLNYLTIPMALKLKSNEIGYLTYFAELGFSPQVNIGSRASSTGSDLHKDNVSKEINAFNISFFFGGGIEKNIGGQTSLVAGIFFNNGFGDILSADAHKAALNYVNIRLGIMF
jgi:hypothetical protein